MRYCRFNFENSIHYGVVEDRGGEPWIVDLAEAPEEDLVFRLAHGRATSWSFDFEPMPLGAADLLVKPVATLLPRCGLTRLGISFERSFNAWKKSCAFPR